MAIELTFAIFGLLVFGPLGLLAFGALGVAASCTTAAIVTRVAR